jgi:periplasmic protein TonB
METNKILSADVLDILFDGRNKEYGAYTLRKGYNGRLGRSLLVMGGVVIVLFMMSFVTRKGARVVQPVVPDSLILVSLVPDHPLPPPPPVPVHMQPVATVRDVTIRIVPDNVKTDPFPENKDLETPKIGTQTVAGPADDVLAPPSTLSDGRGNVVEAPKLEEDLPLETVEIEATYPGGVAAWIHFLDRNFRYPEAAADENVGGKVMVRFIVDKDGNVSNVEAISGPDKDGLREEAVRVIKKSGKWIPAVQNGRNVKSYKRQPVTFVLGDQ